MLIHPLGRVAPCWQWPRSIAIGPSRHRRSAPPSMVAQRGRWEDRNRPVEAAGAMNRGHGIAASPISGDQHDGRANPRRYTARCGRGSTRADPTMTPVSPAIRAIDPERCVVSRAARLLVPARTTGVSQAREFASYVACDATPSLALSAVRRSHSRWLLAGGAGNSLGRPCVDPIWAPCQRCPERCRAAQ
jgi:hypothetical protein